MSYATVRDGLEAAINTVANVGVVHDYWRYKANVSDYVATMTTTIGGTKQVRAWLIGLQGIEPAEESALGEQGMVYQFELTGYQSVNDADATEKTFVAIAEQVMRAVMQKHTFGASGARVYSTTITGVTIAHVMFGDVFCHRAQIGVAVTVDFAQDWS